MTEALAVGSSQVAVNHGCTPTAVLGGIPMCAGDHACATCRYAPVQGSPHFPCAWPDWPCYHEFGYPNEWSCHYEEQKSMSLTRPCRRCEYLEGDGLIQGCVSPGDCKYDYLSPAPSSAELLALPSMFRPKGVLLDSYQTRDARHRVFMLKLLGFMLDSCEPDWQDEYVNDDTDEREKERYADFLRRKVIYGRYYRATMRWYKIMGAKK